MRSGHSGIVMTFPTERNGYQQAAVDARIRELQAALDKAQAHINEMSDEAARLQRDNRALRSSSEAASQKEAAIAAALVTIEQQRLQASADIDTQKALAYKEAERILAEARSEAADIAARAEAAALTTAEAARRASEESLADARAECEAQRERLEALEADYERRLSQIRREIGALLELLPRPRQTSITSAGVAGLAMPAGTHEPYAGVAHSI